MADGEHQDWSYSDKQYWDSRYSQTLDRVFRAANSAVEPAGSAPDSEEPTVFDWLCDATALSATVLHHWSSDAILPVVLDLGCGNSEFPEVMARGGTDCAAQSTEGRRRGSTPSVGYVLGVDYSSTGVLESMSCRARERGLSGAVDYITDDVRTLPLRDATVDVVVDKGCLDSVLQDADQVSA
jgi:SAM-dependent methyltransferase